MMEYAYVECRLYMCGSNLYVLLNYNIIQHCPHYMTWSDDPNGIHQRHLFYHFGNFHPLVHLTLRNTGTLTFFYKS